MKNTIAAAGLPGALGPPAVDDAELVRRVLAGEGTAFELLMRRHNQRLYRLARSVLRNAADAEDALQEAYLSAFRSLGAFRSDSSLVTWLSRLVTNECLTRLRRQGRRDKLALIVNTGDSEEEGPPMPDAESERPEGALERAELRALLERKLDELPDDFRTVFVLRSVEELSVEETAEVLGVNEATVRTRHFRARSMLRESLAQDIDLAERDVFAFDGERCDRIVATVLARLRGG